MSVADVLKSAPLLLTPAPLRVSASAVLRLRPLRSSAAPLLTTVPPAVVPRGELVPLPAAPKRSVPADTVVMPAYELAPSRVSVPAPSLVSVPVPEITPL